MASNATKMYQIRQALKSNARIKLYFDPRQCDFSHDFEGQKALYMIVDALVEDVVIAADSIEVVIGKGWGKIPVSSVFCAAGSDGRFSGTWLEDADPFVRKCVEAEAEAPKATLPANVIKVNFQTKRRM